MLGAQFLAKALPATGLRPFPAFPPMTRWLLLPFCIVLRTRRLGNAETKVLEAAPTLARLTRPPLALASWLRGWQGCVRLGIAAVQ